MPFNSLLKQSNYLVKPNDYFNGLHLFVLRTKWYEKYWQQWVKMCNNLIKSNRTEK